MISLHTHPLLSIFQDLDKEALSCFSIRKFEPREHIITANTFSPTNLFLILEGVCVVSKAVINQEIWYSAPYRLAPGDFIGLVEVISPTPMKRQAYVTARTPVTTLEIPGEEVKRWQAASPVLYNTIITRTLNKQYDNRDILYHCASYSANTAGAYYLCYLYEIYCQGCYSEGYEGPVRIQETHRDLSAAITRNIRTIDRLISSFQKDKMLQVKKGSIYISKSQHEMLSDYIHLRI